MLMARGDVKRRAVAWYSVIPLEILIYNTHRSSSKLFSFFDSSSHQPKTHNLRFAKLISSAIFKMKTSISVVSIMLGICLSGVQAELPYRIPNLEGRSPPIMPPPEYPHPPHHHPTGAHSTGGPHHHPTSVRGHIKGRPTGHPGDHPHHTGTHTYPTGIPHHHKMTPRDLPHNTFITVTGTGTGGHAQPTGHHPWHPHPPDQCKTNGDCKFLSCAMVSPNQGPQCVQGREGKFCSCTSNKAT
ncbi:hypothetical protein F4819DRAFT_468648 [Hypoxylon fuscum]|nr:hypothetical protein F4819DRAFT_468648 [Hypoxylon fuscum]